MTKTTKHVSCPKCSTLMSPSGPAPVLCLNCGWVPLAEIERQLTYWSERREKALLDQALHARIVRETTTK